MTAPSDFKLLSFFATPEHPCSYLDDRQAVTVFADPDYPKDSNLYSVLSRHGFRRSGEHIYRPHCTHCNACTPLRVLARQFTPNRNQRRAWKKNKDLSVTAVQPAFASEHFELYRRYLASRHPDGGMDNQGPNQYLDFLTSIWSDTTFFEFRKDGKLLAVAVCDRIDDGLSAVYSFYDPDYPKRSLGTYLILWLVEHARNLGLHAVYLGYWIAESRKMAYKSQFHPAEQLDDGVWKPLGGET